MKKFIVRTSIFLILFFACAELISRLIINPFYFYSIDSYNLKLDQFSFNEVYNFEKTEHVDYLFIGTSRVPAAINPAIIMEQDSGKVAIVAGRGYLTAGIHYQALANRILEFPDYLRGAEVFIEYPGPDVYTDSFSEDKLKVYEPILQTDEAMPHLLLPHLNFKSLIAFLRESNNSIPVKIDLVLQYCFSAYRTSIFIKEKAARLDDHLIFKETQQQLVSDGGIRNDNLDNVRQIAIDYAAFQVERINETPLLTFNDLDKCSLKSINNLIVENGGALYLFKMPLSSFHEYVYSIDKSLQNKQIFEKWIASEGIQVITNNSFHYQDSDFPDIWHLSKEKRDEFTALLYDEIEMYEHKTHSYE